MVEKLLKWQLYENGNHIKLKYYETQIIITNRIAAGHHHVRPAGN